MFLQMDESKIGNDYFISGTVEKHAWREGMKVEKSVAELRAHMSDFKSNEEIRFTQPGYYPKEVEPPIMEPPDSSEWVKRDRRSGMKGWMKHRRI